MADLIKTIEDDEEVPDLSEPSDEEDDVSIFFLYNNENKQRVNKAKLFPISFNLVKKKRKRTRKLMMKIFNLLPVPKITTKIHGMI